MSYPRVISVADDSAAAQAGLAPGDELLSINNSVPKDVIEYQMLVEEPEVDLEIQRGQFSLSITVRKTAGEPLGAEVDAAIFDQVRTCDNHCSFCFIYQLPKGMRKSLYLKDDDYRLSFLYGNFTTLTRFTELDLERVIEEKLSPLYVSIHATDPKVRAELLRNDRGAMSLRWLRALLDAGIEVHGQVVVCPGVNDGAVFEDTLAGILDEYPDLASVGVVPLGVSDYSNEPTMRSHTPDEVEHVLRAVEEYQQIFQRELGRRMVFASDEYYVLAKRPIPESIEYEGFPQQENGIGIVRSFVDELEGTIEPGTTSKGGFFAWVEGAPAEGYRAPRTSCGTDMLQQINLSVNNDRPIALLTGSLAVPVFEKQQQLLESIAECEVKIVEVPNSFFGGNIGVAGLMTATDIEHAFQRVPNGYRILLPDVCLSNDTFLDGASLQSLSRPVEVVPTNGSALRQHLARRKVA